MNTEELDTVGHPDTAPAPEVQTAALPPALCSAEGTRFTVSRAWPLDHGLAVELTDGNAVRAGWWDGADLELLPAGTDPKLKAFKELTREGAVISHRPGKRAVVRRQTSAGTQFVKVVRRGKAAGILDGIQRAADFAGPFRTPEVIDHDDATVSFSELAGRSLHQPENFAPQEWALAWAEVLDAWVQSTGTAALSSTVAADQGPLVHRAEAETGVLRHWLQLVRKYLSDPQAAEAAVDHVIGQLGGLSEDRLTPAHRDLHDKQLLWSPNLGPGLLDVDTACLADPALDLGNLRAHALLRRMQGLWTPAQAESVQFCVDDTAERVRLPRESVAVYERAALLRLGLVYAVRPQYADIAAQLRQLI